MHVPCLLVHLFLIKISDWCISNNIKWLWNFSCFFLLVKSRENFKKLKIWIDIHIDPKYEIQFYTVYRNYGLCSWTYEKIQEIKKNQNIQLIVNTYSIGGNFDIVINIPLFNMWVISLLLHIWIISFSSVLLILS